MSIGKVALVVLAVWTASNSEAFAQRERLIGNPIPPQAALTRVKLTKAWWGQATLDPTRDKLQSFTLDDDKLFVQSRVGIVTAFDSETGKRLWARQVGKTDSFAFAAGLSENSLLLSTGLELYALSKETGDIQWKVDLQRQAATSPVADDENVYVGGLDGSVTAYNLKLTAERFQAGLLPKWYHDTIRWRFNSHSHIYFPPVTTPGFVDVASTNGSVYSLAQDRLKLNYQFETALPVSAPLALYKDSLIVASGDSRLYSIDSRSGTVRWQSVTNREVVKPPQVIQDDLFLTPERNGLFCVSAKTGSERWRCPLINQFLAASPGVVYGMDPRQNLVLVSRSRGTVLATLPLHQFTLQFANDRSDRIYLATPTGVVLALHESAIHDPKFYKFPERQPITPEFAPDQLEQDDGGGDLKSKDADSEEMPAEEMPAEEMSAEEDAPAEE